MTDCRYPQLVEALVVLDSSPERPRRQPSPVGALLGLLRDLDLDTITSRREADEQLREKIPVSFHSSLSLSPFPHLLPPLYTSLAIMILLVIVSELANLRTAILFILICYVVLVPIRQHYMIPK